MKKRLTKENLPFLIEEIGLDKLCYDDCVVHNNNPFIVKYVVVKREKAKLYIYLEPLNREMSPVVRSCSDGAGFYRIACGVNYD